MNRDLFEIELRAQISNIKNGILYPEIAVQNILHSFDKVTEDDYWISVDWRKLREKYFAECTYKPESGYIMIQHSLPPHDVFEWFKHNIPSAPVTNKI